ncbi:MAG: 50S ribosomal protein L32 [Oscillospiraceae bacterium]|nr:50S ribosomal protein L32 [Oscillospiraceae bacterium]
MAVPKRRQSQARRDKRRSSVWKLDPPALEVCPQCKAYKLSHRVCPACGTYNKRVIFRKKEKTA